MLSAAAAAPAAQAAALAAWRGGAKGKLILRIQKLVIIPNADIIVEAVITHLAAAAAVTVSLLLA